MNKKLDIISDKYFKYITEFRIYKQKYFSLYIIRNDKDFSDELLVDRNKKIMVFKNTFSLLNYIKSDKKLYKNDSYKKWVNYVTRNKLSNKNSDIAYATYDFNSLHRLAISLKKNNKLRVRTFLKVLGIYNLIDTYSSQTNVKLFNDSKKNKELKILIDYIYDNFLWNSAVNKKGNAVNLKKISSKIKSLDLIFWNDVIDKFRSNLYIYE